MVGFYARCSRVGGGVGRGGDGSSVGSRPVNGLVLTDLTLLSSLPPPLQGGLCLPLWVYQEPL